MKIRKILLPTDFSEAAEGALPHALQIAAKYGAELTLLHVATPYGEDSARPEYKQLEAGEYREYIKEDLDQLSLAQESVPSVITRVDRDINPALGILHCIEEDQIDLTVMGTHGRSALSQFFLGSVAERIVRHAPCPVLTVAQDRDEYVSNPSYQSVLVAFDFSDHSKEAARQAQDLAARYGARLLVLYVIEQEVHPAFYLRWKESISRELPQIAQEAKSSLRSALGSEESEALEIHVEVGQGKAHSEIAHFAQKHAVDLIVMGTHGLSGLDHMLLGSTTERVVRIASCPVMTFKLP